MTKLIGYLKCFIGRHDWQFRMYYLRNGFAIGDQCVLCSKWSRTAVRQPWR